MIDDGEIIELFFSVINRPLLSWTGNTEKSVIVFPITF